MWTLWVASNPADLTCTGLRRLQGIGEGADDGSWIHDDEHCQSGHRMWPVTRVLWPVV